MRSEITRGKQMSKITVREHEVKHFETRLVYRSSDNRGAAYAFTVLEITAIERGAIKRDFIGLTKIDEEV